MLTLPLPPLRERHGDVPLLVRHLLGPQWQLEQGVMELLESCSWPGNVRQLQNALERGKILADDQVIRKKNLPPEIQDGNWDAVRHGDAHRSLVGQRRESSDANLADADGDDQIDLESLSRKHVLAALDRSHGNKAEAARQLGIARRTLYRMLEKYGDRVSETDG